jgi:hypothetical protein
LNGTPDVTLRTWSHSGGTNAAGTVIPNGGFEPYLNLYFSDGTQMNLGGSGPCTVPTTGNVISDLLPDSGTGECADVYYPTTLPFPGGVWDAGTYTVVLSTVANPGIGNLADGFFAQQVLGFSVPTNYSCQIGAPGYQGSPAIIPVDQPFCDALAPGVQRSGGWALDILNVDSATELASAPEPGSLSLGLLGGVLILARRVRSRE